MQNDKPSEDNLYPTRGRHTRAEGESSLPEAEGHGGNEDRRHHHRETPDHHGRNFWSEWAGERHHGHENEFPTGQALSPKEMEAWREFFHQSFGNWPEEHWIFGGRRFSPWHQGMDTFNPFVATLLSKGGGLLPLYVLHLISQQPRYGNEIMDILAERTNGQWVSNPGAIYPLLTLLEKESFVEGKWEDPEKRTIRIYTITPAGKAEVSRIMMIVEPKLNETIQVMQVLINDLQSRLSNDERLAADADNETASPEDRSQTGKETESI